MSIRAVCVDYGRIVRLEEALRRVEGRTTFVPVTEQWFKCRLFLNMAPDQKDQFRAHETAVPAPQVLTPLTDLSGNRMVFTGDVRMDISSAELGRAIWRVNAEPQPLRKRRRVIGWLVTVERVIEREYEDILAQNAPNVPLAPIAPPGVC